MRCCPQWFGCTLTAFGVGVLVGGLLPSCLVVWILGLILTTLGILCLK